MKLISYFCALLVGVAFCCWGIVSIHTNVFGPMLSGIASLMFGASIIIYLFYSAVEQIVNAGKSSNKDDTEYDSY